MEMSEETFRRHVDEAFAALPEEFQQKLTNVEIMVVDEPDDEQVRTLRLRRYDRLYGLYSGVPQTVPGEERATMPDRIYLFRLPIISSHDTEEAIIQQIRDTLYHEIGHYFGIDEKRLRQLQHRR